MNAVRTANLTRQKYAAVICVRDGMCGERILAVKAKIANF